MRSRRAARHRVRIEHAGIHRTGIRRSVKHVGTRALTTGATRKEVTETSMTRWRGAFEHGHFALRR
jgi:hypothetical protein